MASKPVAPYVVLFGGEGAGKTTMLERLQKDPRITALSFSIVGTKEPGGTVLGEALRAMVLNNTTMDPNTREFLFFADKIEHAATVVRPALAGGSPVLQDRGFLDSFIYNLQAEGLAADEELFWPLVDRYLETPTMAILLDVTHSIGLSRKAQGEQNYFEHKGPAYHERINALYRTLWKEATQAWLGRPELKGNPRFVNMCRRLGGTRWVTINADRPIDEVSVDVTELVLQHFEEYEANTEEWNRTRTPEANVAATG